jgi:integrase
MVWTEHRVQEWRRTGQRYPVAVWTVPQIAAFLDFVNHDRLYAMWWLIALRGLRRGEAAGLRWIDVDLDTHVLMIGQQRIAYGHTVAVGPPKTAASRRTIALDPHTVRVLRAHRRRQQTEAKLAGQRWEDSGYVFTTVDGSPLHPDWLTRTFGRLVNDSGLPPVRLHDLRHGAASLAHAAGADLKTVQELLGHSSIVLTADTYTSVLSQMQFMIALATARLVLAAAARNPGHRYRTRPRASTAAEPDRQPKPIHPKRSSPKHRHRKGRPHAPHARPTKIKTA